MNKDELKSVLKSQNAQINTFLKRLGKLAQTCDNIAHSALPNDHVEAAMQECINLKNDEFLGAKLKPVINTIHKALYKFATAALEETLKAERDRLTASMPDCYKPKKGKKTETYNATDVGDDDTDDSEVSNPALMLHLASQ